MKFDIPEYVRDVLRHLTDAGYEAFLVGGCVRDAALGIVPHDYDITTGALPEETLSVFRGYRVIETGLRHGTVTVISDCRPIEVTTYRIDGEYLDGRHPSEVTFTDNIHLDLSRRDFTVNAMAYSPRDGLCDPFGGMNDLARRRIACVGDPRERFTEDGLRILRALRFASVLDFSIDDATSAAVRSMFPLLRGISRERIAAELRRLVCGVGAARITAKYPEVIAECLGINENDAVRLSETVSRLEADPVVRLAAAAILSGSDDPRLAARRIMSNLKSSSADRRRAETLAAEAAVELPRDRAGILRLMGRLDASELPVVGELRRAVTAGTSDGGEVDAFLSLSQKLAAEDPCVRIDRLAVGGDSVMRITGREGREVGEILRRLLDGVIDGRLKNDRETLETALATEFVRERTLPPKESLTDGKI